MELSSLLPNPPKQNVEVAARRMTAGGGRVQIRWDLDRFACFRRQPVACFQQTGVLSRPRIREILRHTEGCACLARRTESAPRVRREAKNAAKSNS